MNKIWRLWGIDWIHLA